MKECCQWWSAIKSLGVHGKQVNEWAMAIDRCCRQHKKRVAKPPKRNVSRNVASWYEATRRLLAIMQTKRQRCNPWQRAIENAWTRSKNRKGYIREQRLVLRVCPKCQHVPKWVGRCLKQHKRWVAAALQTDWQRKLGTLAVGARNRSPAAGRKRLIASDWVSAIDLAHKRFRSRRHSRGWSEWQKWAVSVSSDNRRRMRLKRWRRARNKQKATQAIGATGA